MLLEEIPVVSQVILTGTMNSGKNLKVIVGKILIQINAKIGGVPWAIDDMPIVDEPTMICGMDIYNNQKLHKKSVVGFVATLSRVQTNYWSKAITIDNEYESGSHIEDLIEKALDKFKQFNDIFPMKIIFYRSFKNQRSMTAIA
jgi:aubergine-like protein